RCAPSGRTSAKRNVVSNLGHADSTRLQDVLMKHSPLVQQLIDAFTCLPSVGPKSAQRMAYYLLERHREGGQHLAAALSDAMAGVGQCHQCRNFAEQELCPVCANAER